MNETELTAAAKNAMLKLPPLVKKPANSVTLTSLYIVMPPPPTIRLSTAAMAVPPNDPVIRAYSAADTLIFDSADNKPRITTILAAKRALNIVAIPLDRPIN